MSYCRRGPYSDVYIWSDGDMFHVWAYRDEDGPPRWRIQCASLDDLLSLLTDIDITNVDFRGYRVPEEAYDRIEKELSDDRLKEQMKASGQR
jgi:hypothetical protein